MTETPMRPREHVLGDEAQDAFKSRLPSQWIYRPKQSDYGIDGEVEVVSAKGALTGKMFFVQLKGTDANGVRQALSVRLKIGTINYFRALSSPVLIVRFHAKTGRIFALWFDQVARLLPKKGQKTATVRLSAADELSDSRIQKIPKDLDGINQLKSGLKLPVKILLKSEGEPTPGRAVAEVASELRSVAGEGLITLSGDGLIAVYLGPRTIQVAVKLAGSNSFPTEELTKEDQPSIFAANLLTAVGLTLARLDQVDSGARLILAGGRNGNLLNSFQYAFEAAQYLAAAGQVREALELADSMISREGYIRAAQFMAAVRLFAETSRSYQLVTAGLLKRIIREAESVGDQDVLAKARYNLANFLQMAGRHREACRSYHLALRADRVYAERPYFWRELGASLFESGKFSSATRCYECAIALGEQNCLPLLADAQMWSGEYDKSIDSFHTHLEGSRSSSAEWRLSAAFVRMVRDVIGAGKQIRNPKAALELAYPSNGVFEESHFQAAIQNDGLCGLAWFNWAISAEKSGNYSDAAKCFCAAALCQKGDLTAWCYAIGSAMNCSRMDLAVLLISDAYRACGERFSRALFQYLRSQKSEFPKELVIDKLGEVLASLPGKGSEFTLRMFSSTTM